MSIASIDEGNEWIARLENEADILRNDIVAAQGVLSDVGIGSLEYALAKTEQYIEEIALEIAFILEQ
jgi:hypothetical protein